MFDISTVPASGLGAELQARWRDLQASTRELQHPQLCVEWIMLTGQVRPATEVAIVRQGGETVGFFSFERTGRRTAIPVSGLLSDRQGLVATPATLAQINPIRLLRECGLDSWRFDHVQVDQHLWHAHHHEVDPAAWIDLSGGWEVYWSSLKSRHPSWCQQVERKRRKLAREVGPLRFELRCEDASTEAALISWKRSQLQAHGMIDPFAWRWSGELLELVRRSAAVAFEGWQSALYAGQHLVAVLLSQRSHGAANAWIPAHDPAFARFSPGALLHLEFIREAAQTGIRYIDLGRGINALKEHLATSYESLAIGAAEVWPHRRLFRCLESKCRRALRTSTVARRLLQSVRRWRSVRGADPACLVHLQPGD